MWDIFLQFSNARTQVGEIVGKGCQLVMLGSGVTSMEEWMKAEEAKHRDNFRGWVGFSTPVSHRMTAGCDILLMPSRFEPCGLNQLYAMRYGTVPVVHATGGLRDTVTTFNPFAKEHTGASRPCPGVGGGGKGGGCAGAGGGGVRSERTFAPPPISFLLN